MKLIDYPSLAEFISQHPTATIAVPIDNNGTIHAASLLYANNTEPLEFYFVTARDSEKYTLLKTTNSITCAVVVGTEKETPFTLQMRGELGEIDPLEYEGQVKAYYQKRGNHRDDINKPGTCLLRFTPTWARFTDYSKGYERYFLDIK